MTRLIGTSVPAPRPASQPQDKRIFGDPRASPRLRNHETVTHGNEKSGLPGLAENCSVKSHAPDVDAGGNLQ